MIVGLIGYDSIRKHLAACGYYTAEIREKYYLRIADAYIDIKEQRGQYWLENIMKDRFAVSMFGQKRLSREGGIEIDGKLVFDTDYEYGNGKAENSTTNLVSKLSQSYGGDSVLSHDYSYDNNGNITQIKQNGKLTNKYVYDSLNDLKEEYDYVNKFYINYSYGGVKTNYYYDSNKNLIALVKGNDTLLFYYDSDGSATSFSYNGTMYFYVKNLQGDVIRIIDLAGTEVASYVYDAWGNIKDTKGEPTIREINPIRYRGYVYDTETSLYYLQSRYYDPFTGRFLNADDTHYIMFPSLMANLYTYCDNNAISNTDTNGKTAWLWMLGLYAVKKSMPLQFYFHSILNRQRYKCYDFSDNSMYADKILGSMAYYNFKKKYRIINLYPALERMYHQIDYI